MAVGMAHVGGHVTLLFSIHDDELLPRRQGSRGAGLCLDAGVRVRAEAIPAPPKEDSAGAIPAPRPPSQPGSIDVEVSDRFGKPWPEGEAMYVMLINDLRAVRRIPSSTSWRLDVRLELPISQGFGMSAAGFLAAARAVLNANGTPDDGYAARVAHRMERLHRGGLGDVLALQAGGMALRREPGAPNVGGSAEGAILEAPLLLVWQPDESRHTSAYIDHPGWKRAITEAGEEALRPLMNGSWAPNRWNDLLEAAAIGRPIVATDVPGCREVVIDEKNGFLCQPGSVKELVEAMQKMLNLTHEQRLAMGQAGRQIVEDSSSEQKVIDSDLSLVQRREE